MLDLELARSDMGMLVHRPNSESGRLQYGVGKDEAAATWWYAKMEKCVTNDSNPTVELARRWPVGSRELALS